VIIIVLFCVAVLLQFRSSVGRAPSINHLDDDKKKLQEICAELLPKIGIDASAIQADFYE
jgi:hypothetical protein